SGLLERNGGSATGPEHRAHALGGPLDVLGVVVPSAHDDEILDPTGDVDLAIPQEAEVSGAEPARVIAHETRVERPRRGGRPIPIATRNARPGDPDLADRVGRARFSGIGIDGYRSVAGAGRPAAHDVDRARVAGCRGDLSTTERVGFERLRVCDCLSALADG